LGRRYRGKRAKGYYVERNKLGQFKDWTSIPRSIKADTPRKAKKHPKTVGHGHEGDYPK